MDFSFSGPSYSGLPSALAGSILVGTIYGVIAQTNGRPVLILMVRELADWIFYHLASALSQADSPKSQAKIYAVTNLMVNVVTLVVLRQLNLIGNRGTAGFAALMVLELACKYADFSKYRASAMS